MNNMREIEDRLSKLFILAIEARDKAKQVVEEITKMKGDLVKAEIANLEKRIKAEPRNKGGSR